MRVINSLLILAYVSTAFPKPLALYQNIAFDVTKPLETILRDTAKIKSYIDNLTVQKDNKERKLLLLYNLDCDILLDCASSFPKVEKLLTTTINRTDVDLFLSITLPPYIPSKNLTADLLDFNWIQDFGTQLLFNFPKSTTCDQIKMLNFGFFSRLKFAGPFSVGYYEGFMNCEHFRHFLWISGSFPPFLIVHFSFGITAGVTESFGLFQRRLKFYHSGQQKEIENKFLKGSSQTIPITLYYPAVEAIGDNCHQQLLASYSEKLAKSQSQDFGLIVPAPSLKVSRENSSTKGFTMLADDIDEWDFYNPGVMEEISKRFNSVFIHYDDWKRVWRTGNPHRFQENLNINSTNKLEFFLKVFEMESEAADVAELELKQWQANNPFPNVFVGTLLFYIKPDTVVADGPIEKFAKRMLSNFKVGCAVQQNFTNLNSSVAGNVVDACNNINGSLYVLHTAIPMTEKEVVSGKYTFYYENTIRKELEQMKEFGELILQWKPAARLVFVVRITIEISLSEDYRGVTNFCNDQILYLNEYYEAITNWAKCNNLEIVLKSAIDIPAIPEQLSWLTYVRPISGSSYDDLHELLELHPYFVFRNYPNNMNNWKVDPCINWAKVRPDTHGKYFHNSNVGAVFSTNLIRQNEAITTDEYKIMLQLILHRFGTVEIVLQNNTRDLVVACNWLESQNNLFDLDNTVLLNYNIRLSANDMTRKELSIIFEDLKESKFRAIQGIHFDFSKNGFRCIEDFSNVVFSEQILLVEAQRTNIKIGIVLEYPCCMETIKYLVFRNESSHPILSFLERANYLVCQETHEVKNLEFMETMGNVLDSQLYLKKAFQEFLPTLELYSRVIMTDLPWINREFSETYMKTISHFMQFGTAYDIKYLIIDAFDGETANNGWWKIQNFSKLSDPFMFVEKEAELFNRITWRPEPLKNESISESGENSQAFLLSAAGGLLVLCLALSAYFFLRYRKLRQFLSDEEVKQFLNGRSSGAAAPSAEGSGGDSEYMKFNTEYKLHISELHLDIQIILGKGNFGTVYRGTVKEIPAAIKTPNKNCSKACFKSVLSEIKVLCYIGEHSNVVGFLGAYTNEIQRGVLYIATEFCANGSLEAVLRKKDKVVASLDEHALLTTSEGDCAVFYEDLCRFSLEIASGMEHLERKHVVHGDLSVRNVLLDEDYTCKIADFGLSRKLYDYQKYVKTSQEPLPWKWMAYESMTKMEFTSKSDVWSYGVTVWEIFSLGKVPYCTINWTQEFSDELKNGLRLSKPEFASQEIYMKLLDCWNLDPAQRPTFAEMAGFFKELNKTEYVFFDEA